MSKFPTISHLNDLLPFIKDNPQFRVQEQPNGMTVVCYMLQDEDTFSGEHEEYAKECRGITFDKDGKIVSRTLHKFQNVGENDQTQPDMIPWDRIVRIMDKRDGSMITPVIVDGKIVCKTKKTFTSNEAIAATEFIYADSLRVAWVQHYLEAGFTPTFEWTSPRFPIVLSYDRDELTLLHIRDNETGRYQMDSGIWEMRLDFCPFPVIGNHISQIADPRQLLEAAKVVEGVEGWIIQADDGEMWKIKTQWYVKLHHSVTFTRWRDIARTVLADESDDLKAAFAMTGRDIAPIKLVEESINWAMLQAEESVNMIVNNAKDIGMDVKTLAMRLQENQHPMFGMIMSTFRGKTVDYRAWYLKNHIKNWSLNVIVQNEDIEVPASEETE